MCQSALFLRGASGAGTGTTGASGTGTAAIGMSASARVLVVMMAGKAVDSVKTVSNSIKQSGVSILSLGIGTGFEKEQMTTMASSLNYFLSVSSFSALSGISQQLIGLISQGITEKSIN